VSTKVYVVNTFTANGSGGNPAGVVLDADALQADEMLAIAAELGFSETAFVSQSKKATQKLRFFTPTEEVELCGHATIASWSLMFQQGLRGSGAFTQETLAGTLGIEINPAGLVFMEQTTAQLFENVSIAEVAAVLGIAADNFHDKLLPQVVSTGLRDILVPLQNQAALAMLRPDMAAIAKLSKKYKVTGLHAFSLLDNTKSLAAARNFAPLVGIPEEAATGTSNGALLCYLRDKDSLPAQAEYRIEQGRALNQLSYIYGTFHDQTVWIGGAAKLVR
jgi:PhzF family phenazine biosynthesis protein